MPRHYSITPEQRIQRIMSLAGQYQGQIPGGAPQGQQGMFAPPATQQTPLGARLQLTAESTPATPFTRQDMQTASQRRIAEGLTPENRAFNLESTRRKQELQRMLVQTGRGRFDRAGEFIDEGSKLPWERGPDIAERFDDLKIIPQAERMQAIELDPKLRAEAFRRMSKADKARAGTARAKRKAAIAATNIKGDALRERRIASGQLRMNQPRTISPGNVAIQAAVRSRRAAQKERSQSLVMQNAQLRRAAQQASLGLPYMLPAGAMEGAGGVPPGLWRTDPEQARLMAADQARNKLLGRDLDFRQTQAERGFGLKERALELESQGLTSAQADRTARLEADERRFGISQKGITERFGIEQEGITDRAERGFDIRESEVQITRDELDELIKQSNKPGGLDPEQASSALLGILNDPEGEYPDALLDEIDMALRRPRGTTRRMIRSSQPPLRFPGGLGAVNPLPHGDRPIRGQHRSPTEFRPGPKF